MRHFGLSREDVLAGTGLDDTWMEQKDARLSQNQYLGIVSRALDLSADPALGIKVGRCLNLFEYGVWGYSIMSCATAGEAMGVAFRYWELNGALVNVSVKLDGDAIVWTITPAFHMDDPRLVRFTVEEFLSTTFMTCLFLFGRSLDVRGLTLAYPEPDYADLYREFVTCPVLFNSEHSQLIFDRSVVDYPTITGHPVMRDFCEVQCQELMRDLARADKLVETIRHHVIQSMGRFPKADDMARKLAISPRTLYRRLKEKNTSYQAILDGVREDLAMSYLEHTHLSIDQISDRVGFTETTTFRRAFKKWTGVSPSEFRKTGG